MAKNTETDDLGSLNVQNISENENTGEDTPVNQSSTKGAIDNDGSNTEDETPESSTRDGGSASSDTTQYLGPVAELQDKLGHVHPIHAKQLEYARELELQGDVTGTKGVTFAEKEVITTTIPSNTITAQMMKAGSVYGSAGHVQGDDTRVNIVAQSIMKTELNPSVYTNQVTPNDEALVTSGAVSTAIANAVAGRGTKLGPQTVSYVNNYVPAGEHILTDSTVHIVGEGGTITDGVTFNAQGSPTYGAITVRSGADLVYTWVDANTHGWYTVDGEFKLIQNPVADPGAASGATTLQFISNITQDENGEISPTKKTIPDGTTSAKGVVQLTDSHTSTSTTTAATPKSVKEAYDLAAGKLDPISNPQSTDPAASGNTTTFVSSVTQDATGKITVARKTVTNASEQSAGLMSAEDYTKLSELPAKTDLDTLFEGKKDVQSPVNTSTDEGTGLTFVDTVTQDAQGVITVHRKNVKEAASASGGTSATSGILSAADKEKLDGISTGANKVEASSTNGNIKIDNVETTVYTHPTDGANTSKGDTTNQAPAFGGTFKALSATVDAAGHTTVLGEHTVTIPSATAEAPDPTHEHGVVGLMSGDDKGKLDNIASGAEVNQNAYSIVKVGTTNVSATSKTDTLTLVGGNGITITPNASTKTITIDSDALPSDTVSAVATIASAGSSTNYSRADHVHSIALAEGTATGTVSIAGQNVAVKDFGTKADKVSGATENNFAAFDANGNIKDSGKNASNFKTVQAAKASPEASGNDIAFIDTITQNTNGEITATRKTVRGATTSQTGVVQLAGSIGATVSTENNKAASEKAVRDAINALDVTSVGGEGKYITSISETDGKIAPVAETADMEPTLNSKKMITSGGVKAAINALDYTDTKNTHEFVTLVNEADGVISVTHAQPAVADISGLQTALDGKQDNLAFDGTYDATDNKVATVSTVTSAIADLDATKTSTDGKNVQVKVTETDGKITAVNITTDNTENKNNKKTSLDSTSDTDYPTSKAVATYVGQQIATQSATFRGTISLTGDLHLPYNATNAQIEAALNSYTWPTGVTITNHDTVNVTVNNPDTQDIDVYKRFKYSSSGSTWKWEYDINNTTFTQAQMDAINSGATSTKIGNYDDHLVDTNNPHQVTATQVGLGNVVNTGDSAVPVENGTTKFTTGGAYTELAKKADKSNTVTNVAWDATNKKLTKTINGTTTDVVSASTLKTAMDLNKVENKSAADLKAEFKGTITNGDQGFVIGDDVYDQLALKQDKLTTYTPYTAQGSATTVPQITTNSLGQVTGITEVTISGVTPAAHTHGNITNDGEINATSQSSDTAIQSGDKIVITDSNTGSKISRSTVTFDGSTTSKALTPKGTWEDFLQEHQDISGKADWTDTVTNVQLDSQNKKLQQVKGNPNGTKSTTDIANLDGTYNASTNPIATKSTVTSAIAALDSEKSGSSTHVSVTVKETDGKLTSVTVTDSAAAGDHVHGDITNDGKITASAVAVANGDSLVITDSSASGKVVKSNISFDGTTTNKALTQAGTWAEFNNNKAFANVKVGDTTVAADASEDTLELVAGSGITLTPDATNDKVTIAHTNSLTAGTIGSSSASSGVSLAVPYATYDANGHITGKGTHTHTVPTATTSESGVTTLQNTIGATETTSNKAATPKAVRDAINALDVDSVGGDGKYIKSIGETNGKITPVVETMDTAPTRGSQKAVTSDGIQAALDEKLDIDDMTSLSLTATYTESNHRLTFNDIIFDNIYPVVGKYGLAVFTTDTTTAAIESSGDKEWLLDWRPYLIDMNAVAGETAKRPIAELRKANWLRNVDGSFAPVCGITATQSTCLNGKSGTLKWGKADDYNASSAVATDVPAAFNDTEFNPTAFWNYVNSTAGLARANEVTGAGYRCAIEVEVSDGTNTYKFGGYTNTNHIPAPWETTRTDLSVFIGRTSDVYVIDGAEKYGDYMRGLCAKPVPVGTSQFDPEFFKLKRTGISPGPSTTKGNKIRNFFFNFTGTDTNTSGGGNAACFKNNGTYPRTTDASQYTSANWARACNSVSTNAIPVGEGGFFALNAFICSLEAGYKTRNLWQTNVFSTGISSNDQVQNGVWKNSSATAYTAWSDSAVGSNNANGYRPKFQCMEPQIAASIATEMNIEPNVEFNWNGGTWHYEVPSLDGIKTLNSSIRCMNCRIYKKITSGLSSAVTSGGHYMLRCALAEGVNPTGDIVCYQGGGCELVYMTTGTGNTAYTYSFYLEPDQSRWLAVSTDDKHTNGTPFPAETAYTAIITDSTVGGLTDGYGLARTGYTPLRKISGGAYNSGECMHNYRAMSDTDGYGSAGIRTRRRVTFRGIAAHGGCSPRCLYAHYRPSYVSAAVGCAAQVLLA